MAHSAVHVQVLRDCHPVSLRADDGEALEPLHSESPELPSLLLTVLLRSHSTSSAVLLICIIGMCICLCGPASTM